MSGEPRLEADTVDGGRFRVTGDLRGMPASGGLLAVRRVADDQWLTDSGLWSAARPQWFPFRRDGGVAGETWLEVRAAPLLDLIATPPADPLAARLRFVATARHDALELDIDLTLPGAVAASPRDDLPGDASDAHPPMSGLPPGEVPTAEAEPPAGVEPQVEIVPRDGATAIAGDLHVPPTPQQSDQPGKSLSDPVEPTSTAAAIGSRTADAAAPSLAGSDADTLPTIPTESPTAEVHTVPESRPGPPEPDGEPEGETAQALDAKSNDRPITKQLNRPRVGFTATILVLGAIAVTWWLWPRGTEIRGQIPISIPVPPSEQSTVNGGNSPLTGGGSEGLPAEPVVQEESSIQLGHDCARETNQSDCPPLEDVSGLPVEKKTPPELDTEPMEADTKPLEGSGTRGQLESYFKSRAQNELDCARTPNHPDCPAPEDATKPPATDTTRHQLERFFQ